MNLKFAKKIMSVYVTLSFAFVTEIPVFAADNTVMESETYAAEQIVEEIITGETQQLLNEINNEPGEDNDSDFDEMYADAAAGEDISSNSQLKKSSKRSISSSGIGDDEFKITPVSSVYNIANNNNDYVSQATGVLTYEKKLLHLPGVNGLDLDLAAIYSSAEAVITENEFAGKNENECHINFNSFAQGWRFGFPTIIKNNVRKNYGWDRETSIMFPDGSGYIIKNDSDTLTTDRTLTLDLYKLTDMILVRKADSKDYELIYSDGTKHIFDGTYGNIKKIVDRFGNEINFYYTELDYFSGTFFDYIFSPSYYSAKLNALTGIVDSAGRTVNIEYDITSTPTGNEVREIRVKMNSIVYAKLTLKKKKTQEGKTDILEKITDAEGYVTQFEYEEKAAHIFTENYEYETSYIVNGSIMALIRTYLPTGGTTEYEYIKARSKIKPENEYIREQWYESYKISRVSDSGGYERRYEYENDRTGYPYSHIDETTGNIADKAVRYSCLVKQNGSVQMSVFDHCHNKIKELSYEDSNQQARYVTNNISSTNAAIAGNYAYYICDMNKDDGSYAGKRFLCKKNIITGDAELLEPLDNNISGGILKSFNGSLYIFSKTGSGSSSEPYVLNAKKYNPATHTWTEQGSMTLNSSVPGAAINISNMRCTGSVFFSWYRTGNKLYHVIYDPGAALSLRWAVKECMSNDISNTLGYVCQSGGKIYYCTESYVGASIYEYDIAFNTIERKFFDGLENRYEYNYIAGGFNIGSRTFAYRENTVYEFDFDQGTVPMKYMFKDSQSLNQYTDFAGHMDSKKYKIQKCADNGIYYIMNTEDINGELNIYRFIPDSEGDKFDYAGSRISSEREYSVFSSGNSEHPFINFLGTGIESFCVAQGDAAPYICITKTSYNSYAQPENKCSMRVRNGEIRDGGMENYSYVAGKSALLSHTDILGNKTEYEYTDSSYFIPTQIKQYADTDHELITNNTLSADKTKMIMSQTVYSDKTLLTEYTYNDPQAPGNITSKCLYEVQEENTTELVLRENYSYSQDKVHIAGTTYKDVNANGQGYGQDLTHDITVTQRYNDFGQVIDETDELGRTTSHIYNKNGWEIKTYHPDGTETDYTYNLNGAANGENTIMVMHNNTYATVDHFDDLGRHTASGECPPNGTEHILLTYKYDGNRIKRAIDSNGNYTVYEYDGYDRVTSVEQYNSSNILCGSKSIIYDDLTLKKTVNNAGKLSSKYYDNAGRIIREEVQTAAGLSAMQNFYDYMGNVCLTVNPNGAQTSYIYNNRGLLQSVTDAVGKEISYTYDAHGNVLSVTNAGQLIGTNVYDTIGRLVRSTDALGLYEKYSYDDNGRIRAYEDRNGRVISYLYKANTDLVAEKYVDENISTTGDEFTYLEKMMFTYDALGNMLTASDERTYNQVLLYTYSYSYNNLLSSISTSDGKQISYTYDANHNITGANDYAGNNIGYSYNGLNKLSGVSYNNTTTVNYEYYNDGTLKKITYPGQGKSEFVYDNAMRLISQTNTLSDDTVLRSYGYAYDLNGNMTQKTDNGSITAYTYDSLNRLTGVTEPDGTAASYTFDAQGNIMTKNITHPAGYTFTFTQNEHEYTIGNISAHNYTYSYNAANRLMTETECVAGTGDGYSGYLEITTGYAYDANGNLLSKTRGGQADESVVQYTYDGQNRLTQYTDANGVSTSYGYDVNGMRISKSSGSTTQKFYWDRGYIVNESTNGSFTASNLVGAQGIFARETEGVDHMFKDGHGNVTDLVYEGDAWKTYDYDAYGVEKAPEADDTNPFRYCGEYRDGESGLIYLRNRYYDPEIGRFITEDPARDGLNWYAYCAGNPVALVDPWGLAKKGKDLTDDEWNEVMDILNYLSSNDIYCDGDNVKSNKIDEIYKPAGTEIVEHLISKPTIIKKGKRTQYNMTTDELEINFDSVKDRLTYTNDVRNTENTPSSLAIDIAHEIVHSMQGRTVNVGIYGIREYYVDGVCYYDVAEAFEFEAVGLDYWLPTKKENGGVVLERMAGGINGLSENAVRSENSMPYRAKYSRIDEKYRIQNLWEAVNVIYK